MVRKVMKQDLKPIVRGMTIIGITCILFAGIGRVLVAVDAHGFLGVLFSLVAVYLSFFMVFASYIASIARFARSLYSGEGYLTFSLPVTATQLLLGKLFAALVALFYGAAVAVASLAIILSGVPAESWQAIGNVLGEISSYVSAYISSDPMLIVDFVFYVIVSLPTMLLVLYLVASIGQLFNRHRKLISVGIGILLIIVILPILSTYCFQPILAAAAQVSVHLSMWIQIVVLAAVDVGCFFLVRYILTYKLNLLG